MSLKDDSYYMNVGMAYPKQEDYKKVFVYNKGKTIVNGAKRSDLPNDDMKDYSTKGYTVEVDFDKVAYRAECGKYQELSRAKDAEFKADLFEHHGVAAHPKANRAFDIAWEQGHSAGYSEVANYFDDLADLLKP